MTITGLKQEIRQIRENRARELATEMEIQASAAEAVLDKEITEADKNQQIQNHWRLAKRYFYLPKLVKPCAKVLPVCIWIIS